MFQLTRRTLSVTKNQHLNSIIRSLSLFENHLELSNNSNEKPKFHYFWLRDHCRCGKCYNRNTNQIMFDVLKIPNDIKPKECEEKNDKLLITWKDDHKTEYSLGYLQTIYENRRKSLRETVYWNAKQIKEAKDISVTRKEYFKENNNGLKRLLNSILKYGVGFVTEVEPSIEATEKVVRKMAPVQKTIFGEMWEVSNNLEHADTAYTTIELGAHNDNTYFAEPTGLQVFHMLKHDGMGGETLLVDGFNAANNLKLKHPKAYEVLTNYPIESEYIDKDIHYTSIDSILKLHPITKKLTQIRYNIYDRAPLNTLNFDEIPKFYESYKQLGDEINKKENKLWLKLNPGKVVFVDNFRVLHGRASYTGLRRLSGCYVGRNDWTSAAKNLGLPLY